MAGHIERNTGSRYNFIFPCSGKGLIVPGPAHAVYFGTYEIVKNSMGGNDLTEHHPLAAGLLYSTYKYSYLLMLFQQQVEHARQSLAMPS